MRVSGQVHLLMRASHVLKAILSDVDLARHHNISETNVPLPSASSRKWKHFAKWREDGSKSLLRLWRRSRSQLYYAIHAFNFFVTLRLQTTKGKPFCLWREAAAGVAGTRCCEWLD